MTEPFCVGNVDVAEIYETRLDGFPIARQPEAVREAVYTYITKLELTSQQVLTRKALRGP
jgi:hypothetical protein